MKKLLVLLFVLSPVSVFASNVQEYEFAKKDCKGTFTSSGPDANGNYTWDCETLPATTAGVSGGAVNKPKLKAVKSKVSH